VRRSPTLPARTAPARTAPGRSAPGRSAPGRNSRRRSLALSRPRRSERGAALTELVMVLPLLFVLVLGLVESGLNWRTSSELATAVRSGLRTASALGSSPAADQALVLGVASALDGGSTIEKIVVYDASTSASVPPACLTAGALAAGGSAPGACNVYGPAQIQQVVANPVSSAALFGQPSCSGMLDKFWCPADRETVQTVSGGLGQIGLYVKLNVEAGPHFVLRLTTITDDAQMALEPKQ
jgi:Flp pilus assembly protein TadG